MKNRFLFPALALLVSLASCGDRKTITGEELAAGFTDSFRAIHPDEVKYSWWSYRFHAREKNAGWRIDYFIVSNRIADKIKAAEIHNEVFGSDHCPVELDIDL